MKKYLMGFVAACLAVSLWACSAKMDGESTNGTEANTTEIPGSKETETVLTTEAALTTGADKTENALTTEASETGKALTTDAEAADREPVTDGIEMPESKAVSPESEDAASEENYPGADVVEIVNLRGDETTVYKLADGTYMDRIDRRFTYNGTDTWTDEDGVEWNEAVE